MTPRRSPGTAVATTSAGRVAYVPFERAPLDGVRESPEERL